jgi:hypothetical protein
MANSPRPPVTESSSLPLKSIGQQGVETTDRVSNASYNFIAMIAA